MVTQVAIARCPQCIAEKRSVCLCVYLLFLYVLLLNVNAIESNDSSYPTDAPGGAAAKKRGQRTGHLPTERTAAQHRMEMVLSITRARGGGTPRVVLYEWGCVLSSLQQSITDALSSQSELELR